MKCTSEIAVRSISPRFFDQLQTSSHALGNSITANRVHVTIEIYTSSQRSFISHYKATLFGRVLVLIPHNKTSLLRFCTHTMISKLEDCTKSQWRYCGYYLQDNHSTDLHCIIVRKDEKSILIPSDLTFETHVDHLEG